MKSASKGSRKLSIESARDKSSTETDSSNLLEFSLVASEATASTAAHGSSQKSRGKRGYSTRSPASAVSKSFSIKQSDDSPVVSRRSAQKSTYHEGLSAFLDGTDDLSTSGNTSASGLLLNISTASAVSKSDSRRNTIDPSAVDAILQSIDDDESSQSVSSGVKEKLSETRQSTGSRRSSSKSVSTPLSVRSERLVQLEEDSAALSALVDGLDESIASAASVRKYYISHIYQTVRKQHERLINFNDFQNSRRNTIDPAALDELLDSSDIGTEASVASVASVASRVSTEASKALPKSSKSTKSSRRLSSSSVKSSAKKLFPDDNEDAAIDNTAMSISSVSERVNSVQRDIDAAADDEPSLGDMVQSLDNSISVGSSRKSTSSRRRSSLKSSSLGSFASPPRSTRRSTLENGGEILDGLLAHLDDSGNSSKVFDESFGNRRDTADPDTIREIMQSITDDLPPAVEHEQVETLLPTASAESTKSKKKNSRRSSASSAKSPTGSRRASIASVNLSPLTPISVASSAKSSRSKNSVSSKPDIELEGQTFEMNLSLSRSSKSKSQNARRLTVDTDDLENFMRAIDNEEEESLTSSRRAKKKSHDDRRMTADAADMAALLANIDAEENTLGRQSMVSLDLSNLESTVGRESIETAVLIANVQQVLTKSSPVATEAADDDNHTRMSIASTASFVSNLSNLSFDSRAFSENGVEHNDRRMTVDAVDLAALVNGLDSTTPIEEDVTDHTGVGSVNTMELVHSVAGVLKSQDMPEFSSPRRSNRLVTAMPTPSTALRSCMSTKKSARKTVVFGSPQAVEFVKDSKTDSFTPMPKQDAKVMFPIGTFDVPEGNSNDEETSENSRILDEWDRLTCSSAGSDSEDESLSSRASTPAVSSVAGSAKSQSPRTRRRRKSMIQPELDMNQAPAPVEEEFFSDEPTGTVELPSSLGDLLKTEGLSKAARQTSKVVEESFASNEDATEALECDLHSLIDKVGCTSFIGNIAAVDGSTTDEDGESSRSSAFVLSNTSSNESDNSLGALIGQAPDQDKNRESLLLEQPDAGMLSPATSASSFDFGNRRCTLTAPRNSYEPNMSECSGSPMSPLLGGQDEVSINLSNGSMSRRLSKISDSEEIKILNDSQLDMTVDEDAPASPAISSISSKKAYSVLEVEDNAEDGIENIENMLADFEDNLAYDEAVADQSNNKSCATDASTVISQSCRQSIVPVADDMNASSLPVKASIGATPLMARLQRLNADARKTTLSHCQTPLGTSSRLSLGIKRQSFANVASKNQMELVEEGDKKKMKESPAVKASAKKSATKKHIPDTFTGLIADISTFHDKAVSENSFVSVIRSGLEKLENSDLHQVVLADVDEVLVGAIGEANLAVFSDSALDQQWSHVSHAMDKMHIADVMQNGTEEGPMQVIAAQCIDNVNGKYKIWEARLLEISADSVVEKAEAFREQLETVRSARLAVDKEVEYLNTMNAPFDKSSAEMELFELRNRIRLARANLERTRDDVLETGGEISSLLHEKQTILSKIACSSSEAQICSAEAEAEKTFDEKCIQLENLKLSVSALSKMSWCSFNELTTGAISFTVNMSENFRVNVYFTMSPAANDMLSVTKVMQNIETAEGSEKEIQICREFYSRILCDEKNGILGPQQMSAVKTVSDIKSLIQNVRAVIYLKKNHSSCIYSMSLFRFPDMFPTSEEYLRICNILIEHP